MRSKMGRPRKVKNPIWIKIHRHFLGKSIEEIMARYKISRRTVFRYLK